MKKLFLLFLISLLWVSCPSEDSGAKITLDKTSITLTIGKTQKLTATVTNATNKAVTWSTSNSDVATVTGGTVTAKAEGSAIITAKSREDETKTATCQVTVNARLSTDIGGKNELSGKTAAEYFAEKHIFIGWNLGNAFDSPNGYSSWTRKIDKEFLVKIKDAGYSMIRIPVTWNVSSRPIGEAPSYTINSVTMSEVKEVVDWAYDAGLVTVINIHHDGSQNGTTFNAATTNWLSLLRLKQSQTERETGVSKFVKVWEQIAATFKDYGDWLIFEPFNELHNGGWGWNITDNNEYAIINELNQKFTDTVRASGGNNAQRFLVVQPLCAKPHQALAETFVIPPDTATNKQIISMHYYDPEGFALNGSGGVNWGSDSDKANLTSAFESYAAKFTQKGYPLILGESGATYQNRSDATQRATAHQNRIKYFEYMCAEAKRNNIVPVYWDNGTIYASSVGENFGLWDRRGSNGDLEVFPETADKPGMQIIIDTMINAVQ